MVVPVVIIETVEVVLVVVTVEIVAIVAEDVGASVAVFPRCR